MNDTSVRIRIRVRRLIRRDMPDVLAIDRMSFDTSWHERWFLFILRARDSRGVVAELGGRVVGYAVYFHFKQDQPGRFKVLRLAVDPAIHRRGVGQQIVNALIRRLPEGSDTIDVLADERNLPAQFFLRDQGFRAVKVVHDCYPDSDEAAYLMRWRFGEPVLPLGDDDPF